MPPKKRRGPAKKAAPKKAAPNKLPPAKSGGGQDATAGNNGTSNDLPSPTDSVGPTWDSSLRRPPDAVRSMIDMGPNPGLNSAPIYFSNPSNYCYRNALLTMIMYTPQLLAYVQRWHMQMEYQGHNYPDHIMQALDNVAQAYHSTVPTRVRDTEAAMKCFWQLFRGALSSVELFQGAVPKPEDADQEDSSELLFHILGQIEAQLGAGWIPGSADDSKSIFQAMFNTNLSLRTRCPGTQDGLCPDPNQKQRRNLEESLVFKIRIANGENLTLRDCITDALSSRDERWCASCIAQMRHTDAATQDRDDRAWRYFRDCPEVMLIELQRFQLVKWGKGFRSQKVMTPVDIPEILDVSEFLEYHSYGEGSVVQYELKGVASHNGGMKGGHYVAHVKHGQKWWRVDDTKDPKVSASSLARINQDMGGRSGKSLKDQSHPYLLSLVKVKATIVAPKQVSVKAPADPPSSEEPDDKAQEEKDGAAVGNDKKGAGTSGTQAPENGSGRGAAKNPPAPPEDDGNEVLEPPAEAGKCKIWVTLNLGDKVKVLSFHRPKANVSLDCSQDFPFSEDVRIIDDKGKLFTWDFTNPQGTASHKVVQTGSPNIPKKPKAGTTAATAPTETTGGSKRKEQEPEPAEETYVDPTDDTYIAPGGKKVAKKVKLNQASSEEDEEERIRPSRRTRK